MTLRSLAYVSIHASVRDATYIQEVFPGHLLGFNPRIREGCDVETEFTAPAVPSFNPRIREGCDKTPLALVGVLTQFQSTHP